MLRFNPAPQTPDFLRSISLPGTSLINIVRLPARFLLPGTGNKPLESTVHHYSEQCVPQAIRKSLRAIQTESYPILYKWSPQFSKTGHSRVLGTISFPHGTFCPLLEIIRTCAVTGLERQSTLVCCRCRSLEVLVYAAKPVRHASCV